MRTYRPHFAVIMAAIVVCHSLAWASEEEPKPVVAVCSENGQQRMEILGKVVGSASEPTHVRTPEVIPVGYPRGPLIQEEAEERLGITSEPDSAQATLALKVAELDRLQTEVDQLRQSTGTPMQIVVHVEMLEVSHTKLRKLGTDFAVFSSTGITKANLSDFLAKGQPQLLPSTAAAEFLGFLKQNNIAKVLADPVLVTTSGRPASFLVGGQFPMPAAPGSTSAVEFRDFGTSVELLAVALGNNRVRLEVRPRVSELDDSRAIEIAGQRVPSLRVRQCDAMCEMAFGETMAMGGIVQERIEARKYDGGRVEESVNEIGTWVVVRAERVRNLTPPEMQVQGAAYEAPVK